MINVFSHVLLTLTFGQKEKEDKTPTPEVSNTMLTPDNILDSEEPLDNPSNNTLRRRRPFNIQSTSIFESCKFNDSTRDSKVATLTAFNSFLPSENSMENPKKLKYPKITGNYPRILQGNKIHPNDVRKIKKMDGRYTKPPSSEPPVFLKCTPRKHTSKSTVENVENVEIEEEETIENVDNKKTDENPKQNDIIEDLKRSDSTYLQATDLDIQFSKVKLENLIRSKSYDMTEEDLKDLNVAPNSKSQTFQQYCNFEEKKVMRVAPHIRRKDVICDTVDAWSCNRNQIGTESPGYKPLVFGGTYPIDLPVKDASNISVVNSFQHDKNQRFLSKTYDIDFPTSCE